MKLTIDHREQRIKQVMLSLPFEILLENLPLGDFKIEDDQFVILMERKSWKDFYASIQDGRYREQRSRLLQWKSTHQKFFYIIEGSFDESYEREFLTSLRLMIAYDIPVLFFPNEEATIQFLSTLLGLSSLETLFKKRNELQDQLEARQCGKKKNYIDAKLFLMETLSNIRGVSFPIIENICKEFESLSDLISRRNDFEETLSKTTYTTKSGAKRRITKNISEKILQNIFGN